MTRRIGDDFLAENKHAVLRVSSVIISDEFNYFINPNHADFNKIKIVQIEDFLFDSRFK